MKGRIFDIRRFSTHDGAGLRTTVFFKGCPLNCLWCHNPESISTKSRPIYMENRCIGCKTCINTAQHGGVYEKDSCIAIDPNASENWEDIIYNCPADAIRMDSYEIEADELMRQLERDRLFFRDGGGVTFSGGEPLMQGNFLIEMLRRLKNAGINTAIETSLFGDTEILCKAAEYLDIIYADFKVFDDQKHKQFTGVSNQIIKKHIKLLLTSHNRDKVIIRTPLIPDHTADSDNLKNISEFIANIYPNVKYELLNFNPLAKAKYHLINKQYTLSDDYTLYNESQMEQFRSILKQNGIINIVDDL